MLDQNLRTFISINLHQVKYSPRNPFQFVKKMFLYKEEYVRVG